MSDTPEDKARKTMDDLLSKAGWTIQDRDSVNVSAARGVAIREFPLKSGYGFADYLLYVDGAPAGVVEAKKEGETLTGYEIQTEKYSVGLPDILKPYRKPLPFCYQSTGIETRFTNLMEPDARSRPVFAFHRPETMAEWLMDESKKPGSTLRARLKHMPPLIEEKLWPAQIKAIRSLEDSLAHGRPARADSDGQRRRENFYRLQFLLSAHQACGRPAHSLPCGPQQPGAAGQERV